jgi:xylulokinase
MSILLGIDIGTTATKAILLDSERGVLSEKQRSTQLYSPEPGWAEEQPSDWWKNICDISQELSDHIKVDAIAVSGMVPCTILIDEQGRVLRRSIQQNDARAVIEIEELKGRLSNARILERTGASITQQSVGPKLLWLAKHESEEWKKASTVFGSYDYITFLLTGNRTIESNWALESGFYDIESGSWADDILSAAEVKVELLPKFHHPGELAGYLTHNASQETGMQEGIPVFIGSADHVASAFAAGAIREGDLVVKLGGAGDILFVTDIPIKDKRLYLDYHLVPERFLPNGCMASSGSLIRWFQKELAEGFTLKQLDAEAEKIEPGAGGIVALPYFLGEKTPLNDPTARGAFVGLHLGHRRGHLFRAILESIAFGFRHHVDIFAELGQKPKRVRVTDGGTKSNLWTQITSDVLGLTLEKVEITGGSALGAAFVAGMGLGCFSDWSEIERFISVTEIVEPCRSELYTESYRIYRALYPALKGLQI